MRLIKLSLLVTMLARGDMRKMGATNLERPVRQRQKGRSRVSRVESSRESVLSISPGTGLTLLSFIVGGIVSLYQLYIVPVAKSELETKIEYYKKQLQDDTKIADNRRSALEVQVTQLEQNRTALLDRAASPILLRPKSDDIVIANEVTFSWDYKSEQIPHLLLKLDA